MKSPAMIISTVLVTIVLIIGGFILYHQPDTTPPTASTFVLSPTVAVSPTKTPEPEIIDWTTYNNDKFNFSLSVPKSWNQQMYTPDKSGVIIAFSPNSLPCSTCSYVHNGYFSVKIYNQSTDTQSYASYTSHLKNVGHTKTDIGVQVAGAKGVMYGNIVALENNGMVLEFALDKDDGNDQVTDSQLFQKIVTSLQFTNLIFNY